MNIYGNSKFWSLLILLSWVVTGITQNPTGLNRQILTDLQNSLQMDAQTRAVMNAVTNNQVNDLALNRNIINSYNDVFNIMTDVKGVTDQKKSGRCWMYAALNLMRPVAREKFNLESFEFSESYLFFWDKLEKYNFFLESVMQLRNRDIQDRELQTLLDDPLGDGGWWNYATGLIEKYGVVPKGLMPETKNSENSRWLNKNIKFLARQDASILRHMVANGKKEAELRQQKTEMLKKVYKLLVINLGMPPQEFNWRYEDKEHLVHENNYTPVQFYHDAVGINLNDYVIFFNYPAHPFGKLYQVNFRRNLADQTDLTFINLEMDNIRDYVLKSLLNREPVWFAADDSWQMERAHGIMAEGIYDYESLLGITDRMTKADRIQYRASTANHAMAFVGVDTVKGRAMKWRVENSWGADTGDKGYWTMYNNWFDKYVYTVIINRKYLPETVLAILKTKPRILPALGSAGPAVLMHLRHHMLPGGFCPGCRKHRVKI